MDRVCRVRAAGCGNHPKGADEILEWGGHDLLENGEPGRLEPREPRRTCRRERARGGITTRVFIVGHAELKVSLRSDGY